MYYFLDAIVVCDIGKVRTNNEDNFLFNYEYLKEKNDGLEEYLDMKRAPSDEPLLFGVFDGMGGLAKGEWASYVTAKTGSSLLRGVVSAPISEESLLRDICSEANSKICKEMIASKGEVGTTASMLMFHDDSVWACNLGDSPIFVFRNGVLEPIYKEHTERQMWEKILGKEGVKGKKYPLTQHLGVSSEEMIIEPYISSMKLETGDQYIICSDGLTDMVSEENISNVLSSKENIKKKVEKLKELALINGGKDNVTIIGIVVQVA